VGLKTVLTGKELNFEESVIFFIL